MPGRRGSCDQPQTRRTQRQAILCRRTTETSSLLRNLPNCKGSRRRRLRWRAELPELTEEEEAAIHAAALSDPDAQPLTEEELARFRPAYQVMPEFVAKMMRQKRGRPPVETPKKQVTLRLDQDVIDHFKAEGRRLADPHQRCPEGRGEEAGGAPVAPNAAAPSRPSGTRRWRGRTGGPRGSPRPRALAAAHVAAGEDLVVARLVADRVGGDVAALVELERRGP